MAMPELLSLKSSRDFISKFLLIQLLNIGPVCCQPTDVPIKRTGLYTLLYGRAYRLGPVGLRGNPYRLPFVSFIFFISNQHMPYAFGYFFTAPDSCYRLAASAFNLVIKLLDHFVVSISRDGSLAKGHT